MRQCIGCGEMKGKKEMMRVIKTAEDDICLDVTGKKNGRGAYVCRKVDCFEKARKAKRFSRALQCEIEEEIYEKMSEEMRDSE